MIATTRAVVLRGAVAENALGDEVEDNSDAAIVGRTEGYPFSLIRTDSNVFDPSTNEWRTVEKLVGRFNPDFTIDDGDRVKDLRDGSIYTIDDFEIIPRGLSGRSSVTLKLRRTAP